MTRMDIFLNIVKLLRNIDMESFLECNESQPKYQSI